MFEVLKKLIENEDNNFAFDFHGVLNQKPRLNQFLLGMLKKAISSKSKIYICSGSSSEKLRKELDELGFIEGVHYDELCSVTDHLKQKGVPHTFDENGHFWTDDKFWWPAKAEIAREKEFTVLVDDCEKYKEHFLPSDKTLFVLTNGK